MAGRNSSEELPDELRRGEAQLTADLINAASASPGPLSQQEVDELLGVHPQRDDD